MEQALQLVKWIPILPLIGFLFSAFFGKRAGKTVVAIIAPTAVLAAFAVSCAILLALLNLPPDQRVGHTVLFSWLDVGPLQVPFELRVDPLSVLMCLIVTGVGGLIHIYATGYMAEDPDHARFFTYFNLFIVFMLTLVLANNLLVMFIGWEGVGLCSYLLIGFWYKELANAKAGNKAFIVNRIGDFGMLLGIFAIYALLTANGMSGRVLSFDVLFSSGALAIFDNNPCATTMITALLFLGACGKSAQLPLYFWLPDAMAGPTPVSALIHAATMVTAGVVLVTRMHLLFEMSQVTMTLMAVIGAATAVFAATIAWGQSDIKKVLAYSTVSQLGYMFLACGVGAFSVGMFHVTTHAFFKALLFLAAGAVIMAMHHNQDMRFYGGLSKTLKITFVTTALGWLAISGAGIPGVFGFAGFYSKDEILLNAYTTSVIAHETAQVLYWIGLFTALLTAFYMTRMMGMTFWGRPRWNLAPSHGGSHDHGKDEPGHGQEADRRIDSLHDERDAHHHAAPKEPGWSVLLPLCLLAVLSVFGGWYLANGERFAHFLAPSAATPVLASDLRDHAGEANTAAAAHENTDPSAHTTVGWSAVIAAMAGLGLGLVVYGKRVPKADMVDPPRELGGLQAMANRQWGYDQAVTEITGMKFGGAFGQLCKLFDDWVVDGSVRGLAKVVGGLSILGRKTQTGFVRNYAFTMLLGVVALIATVLWMNVKR